METDSPKPCPVCGSRPDTHRTESASYYLFCPNEQCKERPCTRSKATGAEAIAAWNRGEIF